MGLTTATTYEYRVQTYCTPDGSSKSKFTSIKTFTTAAAPLSGSFKNEQNNLVTIYPNPVTNKLTITSTESLDNAVISIADIYGVVVKVKEQKAISKNNLKAEIEVSELIPGIYFLNLKTTHGSNILKFVKM